MGFLILFGVVILLIINFFIADEFYNVAQEKGYDSQKYLWIALFVPIAGYVLVIALPDCKNSQYLPPEKQQPAVSDELPEL